MTKRRRQTSEGLFDGCAWPEVSELRARGACGACAERREGERSNATRLSLSFLTSNRSRYPYFSQVSPTTSSKQKAKLRKSNTSPLSSVAPTHRKSKRKRESPFQLHCCRTQPHEQPLVMMPAVGVVCTKASSLPSPDFFSSKNVRFKKQQPRATSAAHAAHAAHSHSAAGGGAAAAVGRSDRRGATSVHLHRQSSTSYSSSRTRLAATAPEVTVGPSSLSPRFELDDKGFAVAVDRSSSLTTTATTADTATASTYTTAQEQLPPPPPTTFEAQVWLSLPGVRMATCVWLQSILQILILAVVKGTVF